MVQSEFTSSPKSNAAWSWQNKVRQQWWCCWITCLMWPNGPKPKDTRLKNYIKQRQIWKFSHLRSCDTDCLAPPTTTKPVIISTSTSPDILLVLLLFPSQAVDTQTAGLDLRTYVKRLSVSAARIIQEDQAEEPCRDWTDATHNSDTAARPVQTMGGYCCQS